MVRTAKVITEMQWDKIVDSLNYKLRYLQLDSEIKNMESEDELMSYLLANEEIIKFVSLWLKDLYNRREKREERKNLEISTFFKLSGNKEFQLKKYTASLQSYTKSALYAPSDSMELPIAIANRSASLFYLDRWQDCVEDIELAIKLGHPEELRYKLHLRAAQCYIKLNKRRLAAKIILQLHDIINNIPSEKREQLQKQMNEMTSRVSCMEDDVDNVDTTKFPSQPEITFGENPNFRSASAAIDIKYMPEKGRYVVANRNIKRGQILFVEKAFAFVPLNYNKIDNICHNCCHSYNDIPVPCAECVDAVFCNINCWNEARSSYHHWECSGSQMGIWPQIGVAHLALKILLMCTSTTDNNRFNEVQELVTNFRKLSPVDVISYGIVSDEDKMRDNMRTATMLTLYLSKYTDFFKVINIKECLASKFSNNNFNINCDLATEDDEQLYVSSLLLRHILQLIANGHAITKINAIADKDKLLIQQQDRIATAIYPSASMMNHSCDPNIINSFLGKILIVKATQDIEAGEEVSHSYGADFRRMSSMERLDRLESQYCFTCCCKPCTMPEYENFMKRFTAVKCPECSGPLYDIYNSPMHCLDCGVTVYDVNYVFTLRQARIDSDEAEIYMRNGRYEEALAKLKECLSLRRGALYKYHEDITATLNHIAQVYAAMEQWLNSISYLEHSIVAIKERYGSSSVEVCNELNNLTDICIKYLQGEPNTGSKFYKNVLKKTRRHLNHAQEIVDLTYGPWNEVYREIAAKKEILSSILKNFNV